MIAFRRNGVDDMLRLFGRELLFDGRTRKNGQIVAFLPRFPLGVGEYGIAILLAGENYYEENPTMFYTINPKVYWAGRNIVHIKVTSDHIIPRGTGVVGEAVWSIPLNKAAASAGEGLANAAVQSPRNPGFSTLP